MVRAGLLGACGWAAYALSGAGAAEPVYPDIRKVHVVHACHLDIGFADFSSGIINRYFDHHFPLAAQVGDQLRKGVPGYTDNKLNFMFQSWVLDAFFDCPTGLGLHCPDEAAKDVVRQAIAKEDITWHAFPHNAELELMDPALVKAGVQLTHTLDARFGKSPKRTLSQRDVPGMTRALIPLLRAKGVAAISVGENSGSTPPDLPPCFVWKDPASGESILGLFTWPGYGGLPMSTQKTCIVEGLDETLVYLWNGDNAGPWQAEEYGKQWQQIAASFPNAKLYASTLDNFTTVLEGVRDKLPLITNEVGDTWLYGVPSDPQKVSRMGVVNRAWASLDLQEADGIEGALARDPALRNATRFALKLGEHTWGKDVKSNLFDNWAWKNADFEASRASEENRSQYQALETSWWEQRHWGLTAALEALDLGSHPLAQVLRNGFAELLPAVPNVQGFRPAKAGDIFNCGGVEVGFDATGAIGHLVQDGFAWADSAHVLLQQKYRSYSATDFTNFFQDYIKDNGSWVVHDYGKPGLPDDVESKVWLPELTALYAATDRSSCGFVLHTRFGAAQSDYGAAEGWTQLSVGRDFLNISVGFFNKTATRLPEAMFLQFLPTISAGEWSVNKLGEWVDASQVIDGGSKHLHASTEQGFRVVSGSRQMSVASLDVPLVSFGEPTAFPTPVHQDPDTSKFGGSFVVWENLWGTNYIMWWPFEATPPSNYSTSAALFPAASNADTIARLQVQLTSAPVVLFA